MPKKSTTEVYHISFDQATDISGYCVWKNGKYICHGAFNLKSQKLEEEPRLREMMHSIIELIEKFHPPTISFEDTQFQNNAHSYKLLCRLQGMIIEYCYLNDICFFIYPPSTWRKILGIKGKKRSELKAAAIDYVKTHYNIDATEDECEAICIGAALFSQYGEKGENNNGTKKN